MSFKLQRCPLTCFLNAYTNPCTTISIFIQLRFTFTFLLKVFTNFIFTTTSWWIHLTYRHKCLTFFLSFVCNRCQVTLFNIACISFIIPLTIFPINIFNTSNFSIRFRTWIIFNTTSSTSSNTFIIRKISLTIFICFHRIWSILTSFFLTAISIISSTWKQVSFTLFVCD